MSQKYNEQLMLLHQAAQKQRAELEQQANSLALEYCTRKTKEEFMHKQYALQKEHYDLQVKLRNELQKLSPPAPGAAPVPAATLAVTAVGPAASQVRSASFVPEARPGSYVPEVRSGSFVGPAVMLSPSGSAPPHGSLSATPGVASPAPMLQTGSLSAAPGMPHPPHKAQAMVPRPPVMQNPASIAPSVLPPPHAQSPGSSLSSSTRTPVGLLTQNCSSSTLPSVSALGQAADRSTMPPHFDGVFDKLGKFGGNMTTTTMTTTTYSPAPSSPASTSPQLNGSFLLSPSPGRLSCSSQSVPPGGPWTPRSSSNCGSWSRTAGLTLGSARGIMAGSLGAPPGAPVHYPANVAGAPVLSPRPATPCAAKRDVLCPCPSCGSLTKSARRRPDEGNVYAQPPPGTSCLSPDRVRRPSRAPPAANSAGPYPQASHPSGQLDYVGRMDLFRVSSSSRPQSPRPASPRPVCVKAWAPVAVTTKQDGQQIAEPSSYDGCPPPSGREPNEDSPGMRARAALSQHATGDAQALKQAKRQHLDASVSN